MQKFFNTLVESAKEIYPDITIDQSVDAMRADMAGEQRTAQSFIDLINTDKGFNDFMQAAMNTQREGAQQGYTDAETRRNEATHARIRTTFNPKNNGTGK